MLPDIRAVIAAMVAAVGLLMISFGLVATWRVAREGQSGVLQTDLAARARDDAQAAAPVERPILIIDTPGPHLAPMREAEPEPPPPQEAAAPVREPEPPPAPVAAALPPPADPPVGGPLAPPPESTRGVTAEIPAQAAAEKARKARIARERRARRAAAARRARQQAAPAFGNAPFAGTFASDR